MAPKTKRKNIKKDQSLKHTLTACKTCVDQIEDPESTNPNQERDHRLKVGRIKVEPPDQLPQAKIRVWVLFLI